MPPTFRPDATRDLLLERVVDVPRELVWRAWTLPEHVKRWFTPAPWATVECEIDLRPGGIFRTVMRSPEGQDSTNLGCYLEIVENERLVWTTALAPGYRPATDVGTHDPCGVGFLTAVITLESKGKGTKYTALAMHGDEKGRRNHEELGFHDGWGTALDQLVAHARTM
jgi:uncharacterized protein YndB with AHSA1/START domain